MLYTAFILGLAGSLHCMVMCGPLAMLLQAKTKGGFSSNLLYHIGRISIYTLLGFIFGLLGRVFNIITTQNTVFIIIGSLFLLFVFLPQKTKNTLFMVGFLGRQINGLKVSITKTLNSKSPFVSLAFGALNGLIPCGLVYFAFLAALAMPSTLDASLYMIFFGLGTVPLLLFAAPVGRFFQLQFGRIIPFKQSYAIALLGCLFLLRGLGLGIPYLSPNVNMNSKQTEISQCE